MGVHIKGAVRINVMDTCFIDTKTVLKHTKFKANTCRTIFNVKKCICKLEYVQTQRMIIKSFHHKTFNPSALHTNYNEFY